MFDLNQPLALSDGTPVVFVKETSKGNVQVRLPEGHALSDDPLRIFRPDGSHYKDAISLTLVNSTSVFANPAVAEAAKPVDTDTLVRAAPAEPEAKGPTAATIASAVPSDAKVGVITFIDLGADGKFGLFRLPG